jgi:DNA-directed RNA polymerase subunit M/transcription elongation factor TFIIS
MSQPLPPFSGDTPTCPKCGHEHATTRYMHTGFCLHLGCDSEVMENGEVNERLHRECGRCGYAWDEATVEQQPAKTEDRGTA